MALLIKPMAMASIADAVHIDQTSNPYPWRESTLSKTLLQCFEGEAMKQLAAYDAKGQTMIAFVLYQVLFDSADIVHLVCDKSSQRQGVASALFSALKQQLPEQVKVLFLEVRESNHAALALYEKQGFHVMGTRKNYYQVGKEHAITMRCLLH